MTSINTAKAPKVTLNSIIFAAAPALRELAEGETHTKAEVKQHSDDVKAFIATQAIDLAKYLINKTDNIDQITALLTAAVAAVPGVMDEVLKAKAEEEAAKEEEKRVADAAKEAERVQAEKEIEDKKRVLLKSMLDNGLDLAVAQAAVATAAKAMAKGTNAKNSYDRVTCEIDGEVYDVPVRGNMSQALKDLAAKYNFSDDRDGFIAKFRKVESTENDNAEA